MASNISELERRIEALEGRRITQRDIINRAVKQRHIEALLIFKGLATDRPNGSTDAQAYFATDTGVLSIWDGESWLDVTLS